jgi:acylphosphatase
MKKGEKIRETMIFKGHVQGVGFRASTLNIAQQFDVTGTVENLSDGTVRVIVEGPSNEINDFVKAIQSRLGRYINGTHRHEDIPSNQFTDFSILH